MDDEDRLFEVMDAYQEKFGDTPTISMLDEGSRGKAIEAMRDAIQNDKPFEDDAAFCKAIGIEPAPDDAVI